MVDPNKAAIIASSVLASTCVILIILIVYLLRVYGRKQQLHSSRDTIKQPDFPPFTPVHKPVQPPLRFNEDQEDNIEPHKYGPSPKHNISKATHNEEFEAYINPDKYGPDMYEFYHSRHPRSGSASPSIQHSKSTESLDSNLNSEKHKHDIREHPHHPLTNSVSIDNLNTECSSPRIRRIKTKHRRTWHKHSSQYRDLSLFRGISELHLTGHGSPATSSSTESLRNLESYHSDEKSQPFTSDSELSERPSLGEILVALCHNPSEGKLTITIKSAEGLQGVSKTGKINPFIKIRVYDCGERRYKKKTTIKHNTTSPNYEESFDFVVTGSRMPQTSVILRLHHHGHRVLNNDVLIGVVFLGYQFELVGPHPFMLDHGARHWASIIEKPHLTIEEWHPIQAFST